MVVPAGVRRLRAAAQRRLVHHVVVVQRREMGELDHARGGEHVRRGGVAGLGGQEAQQRPEPLAAGLHQVPGRLGDERCLALHVLVQRLLDLVHPGAEARLELGVEDREGQGLLDSVGHLMNSRSTTEHVEQRTRYDAQHERRGRRRPRSPSWSGRSAPPRSDRRRPGRRRTSPRSPGRRSTPPPPTSAPRRSPPARRRPTAPTANTAHLPVKPLVSGIPAMPSSRNANIPATSGDSLPRPAQRERWVASPPESRTTVTIAKAAIVIRP